MSTTIAYCSGKEYDWSVTEFCGAEIVPYDVRVEQEAEVYYTPSPYPPTLEDKVSL